MLDGMLHNPMPGSLNNRARVYNYTRSGRKNLTPKQMRRLAKYTNRYLYNPVRMGCGHRAKKCDCPF
jgi:hypothetical protein